MSTSANITSQGFKALILWHRGTSSTLVRLRNLSITSCREMLGMAMSTTSLKVMELMLMAVAMSTAAFQTLVVTVLRHLVAVVQVTFHAETAEAFQTLTTVVVTAMVAMAVAKALVAMGAVRVSVATLVVMALVETGVASQAVAVFLGVVVSQVAVVVDHPEAFQADLVVDQVLRVHAEADQVTIEGGSLHQPGHRTMAFRFGSTFGSWTGGSESPACRHRSVELRWLFRLEVEQGRSPGRFRRQR